MPYWNKAQNTNLKRSLLEVHVAHTKPSRMQRLSAARVCSELSENLLLVIVQSAIPFVSVDV